VRLICGFIIFPTASSIYRAHDHAIKIYRAYIERMIMLWIVLWIVVLLGAYDGCGCARNDINERFDPKKRPSDATIRLLAERTANEMAQATRRRVALLCRDPMTEPTNRCIAEYAKNGKIFDEVIRDPLFDLYENLKRLETYAYEIPVDIVEKRLFVNRISNAYIRALEASTAYMKTQSKRFDLKLFVQAVKQYTEQLIGAEIKKMYDGAGIIGAKM
jgi:hypothetical protein